MINNIKITPIPGPTAITTSLMISGAKTDKFLFLGFLDRNKDEYIKILRRYSDIKVPLIIFEKTKRIKFLIKVVFDWFEEANLIITKNLLKFTKKSYLLTSLILKNILRMILILKESLQLILELNKKIKKLFFQIEHY